MIAFLFVSEYCPLSVYFETNLLSVDLYTAPRHILRVSSSRVHSSSFPMPTVSSFRSPVLILPLSLPCALYVLYALSPSQFTMAILG